MFVLTTTYSKFTNHLYDIATLEDVLIGLTDDEDEAKRITTIAENMKIGDTFSGRDIYLKCKTEE